LPAYISLRWEAAPEGWELWGVKAETPFYDEIQMLAWAYRLHHKNKWAAIVYVCDDADGHEFDTLEDAQAWCITCVRMS
jgi:hypothetical protein